MKYDIHDPLEVWVVHATDWCYYEQSRGWNDKFTPIEGYLVGFIIEQDDEKIVLAHQVFKENESVRHVTVVTKSSIISMLPMKLDDSKESEDEIEDLNLDDLPEEASDI
ncbi:MAG: hypothetical protein PVI03_03560 [Candidatus Thorarchaeota archaeon]|jgi:hypothetical protein